MIIVAWFIFLSLGLVCGKYFYPHIKQRSRLFLITYLIASVFMFLFHWYAVYNLKISYSLEKLGAFSPDGAFYHEAGAIRSTRLTNPMIIKQGSWTIAWQYVIAVLYRIFGVNTIYPKIFNVFCFSIAAIAFMNLSFLVSNSLRTARRSYWMFTFFIPLLYYNGTMLRETFMAFLVIMIVYFFAMLWKNRHLKWIILFIVASLSLFLTRAELMLIIGVLILITFVLGLRISISRKIAYGLICVLVFGFFSSLSFVKETEIIDTITGEGGRNRYVKASTTEKKVVTGGYLDYAIVVASSPLLYTKAIISGTLGFFLNPLPNKFLQKRNYMKFNNYFFCSLYNVYFYLLLPAIFFGVYFKLKLKVFNHLDFIIVLTVLLMMTAISLNMRDPLRYRTPVFGFLLLYASHGISLFKYWEKYIGLIIVIMCAGALFFTLFFDVKSLVS